MFSNGGDEEVYLANADWMPRNLDKRVELMFPVESASGRRRIHDALDSMFHDNVKGRRLLPTGEWRVAERPDGVERFEAQQYLHEQTGRERAEPNGTSFVPLGNPVVS